MKLSNDPEFEPNQSKYFVIDKGRTYFYICTECKKACDVEVEE